jgi:drug/metabolite transporter (DMT)-like permease
LIVTGLFAVAFAYVVQVWAQRRVSATRIAIVFSLETVFAGLFGYLLAGDRLGALGFAGCAAIFAGIVVAEPAAASTLRRLVGRPAPEPGPLPPG